MERNVEITGEYMQQFNYTHISRITYSNESIVDVEHGEVITFMDTKHPSPSFLREKGGGRGRERENI